MAKLDWNAIAHVNFDDARRERLGIPTGRQLFAKAHEQLRKSEEALKRRQEIEPLLKAQLVKHMASRQPIVVESPINNPTEVLGGLNKSQDDDDDGFYNTSPSRSQEAALSAKFEEVMETIPAGVELVYKGRDTQLQQFIFKGSNGKEYAIYEKPIVMFRGQAIENPGLFGLLFQTHLINYVK